LTRYAAPDPRLVIFQRWTLVLTATVFVQLVLGAAMRHSHGGLSIHDFPTAYGGVLPPIGAPAVYTINQARAATGAEPPTSAGLILLQYAHRVWAVALVIGILSIGVAAV